MQRDKFQGAAGFVPERPTLPALREKVQRCKGCDLYLYATQAVMGEEPRSNSPCQKSSNTEFAGESARATSMDQQFEAPGGAGFSLPGLLTRAANAVKHFKFEERGTRRLHKKPRITEVRACRPWLEAEASVIHPRVTVRLGAGAARSFLGPGYRLTKERRKIVQHPLGAVRNRYRPPLLDPASAGRSAGPHQQPGSAC